MKDTNATLHRIRRSVQQYEMGLMEEGANSVLTPYPNTGKSFGFHKNLSIREEAGTILQPNRALRSETGLDAEEENGLDVEDLPSFPKESPLLDETSPWYSAEAAEWYDRGMPPASVYDRTHEADTPPLEEDEYRRKMQEDLTERDLLMGDPVHAFMERAVAGRHVAMDDIDPYGSFVDKYDAASGDFRDGLWEYLGHHREWLLDRGVDPDSLDLGDVLNPDQSTRNVLLALSDDERGEPSAGCIPDTERVTADTSRVLFVLMMTDDGEDRAEWVETSDFGSDRSMKYTGVRLGETVLLGSLPVHLRHADSLTMMTATPVVPVFETIFEDIGVSSAMHDPMTRGQKEAYIEDVLGSRVVQTTRSNRFVSGGNNVREDKFQTTVHDIIERHGERPVVISSKKALRELEGTIEDLGLETMNFAKAVGTNAFDNEELAVIWGAPHYGDQYVQEVAAFCGDTGAEPVREDGSETSWSTGTSQEIYENMCEGTVFQAMMRVGRSSDSRATIYVETNKIPDDVPRVKPEGRDMYHTFTASQQDIIDALGTIDRATARQLAEATGVSRNQVYNALDDLASKGAVRVADETGGEYNAAEWEGLLDAAANGALTESARETLNNMYMEKSCNLCRHEPTFSTAERILTVSGGVEPPQLDLEDPGDLQLQLHNFG